MAKGRLAAAVIEGILEMPALETSAASTTLDDTFGVVGVNATGGNKAVTLPLGSTLRKGRAYWIKKVAEDVSSNTVTVNRAGSDLIDNGTSVVLNASTRGAICIWTGTKWTTFATGGSGASGTPVVQDFTPNTITNTDTALTTALSSAPVANSLDIFCNGERMREGAGKDYTVSGTTVTWLALTGTAPDLDSTDRIVYRFGA